MHSKLDHPEHIKLCYCWLLVWSIAPWQFKKPHTASFILVQDHGRREIAAAECEKQQSPWRCLQQKGRTWCGKERDFAG
jgi:hypothetical protein